MKDLKNYSLLANNTFGIDVRASRFVEYDSEEELRHFLTEDTGLHAPLLSIGGGSNLLFTADFPGVVLHSAIKGMEVVRETEEWVEIRVGAGEVWDDFVAFSVSNHWYGAENLSIIPGEVGASAVQNIGAYGTEVKDLIVEVETLCVADGTSRRFTNAECQYAYRKSIFKGELKGKYVVTYVTYRLSKLPVYRLDYGNIRDELQKEGCEVNLENLRRVIIRIREAKLPDPAVIGNAGSFFMNPIIPVSQFHELQKQYPEIPNYPMGEGGIKVPAGWMIERCGWKGRALGRAAVHDKQALVLINRGGATADEIVHLSQEVVKSVKEKFGVTICPEVNFI